MTVTTCSSHFDTALITLSRADDSAWAGVSALGTGAAPRENLGRSCTNCIRRSFCIRLDARTSIPAASSSTCAQCAGMEQAAGRQHSTLQPQPSMMAARASSAAARILCSTQALVSGLGALPRAASRQLAH